MASLGLGVDVDHRSPELVFIGFPRLLPQLRDL